MGDAIQKQILSDISQCKYFSILVDETNDVSQTEQLSLSVWFIKDTKVHEEFLCFVPVSSTTGKDLASTILTQLSQLGLNPAQVTSAQFGQAVLLLKLKII